MSTNAPAPRRRRTVFGLLLLVLVLAGAGGAWWWKHRPQPVDMTAVMAANNRGVGHMERFKYAEAVEAFEEVRRLAPDWTPGRINLGIALLNEGGKLDASTDEQRRQKREVFQRAIALFKEILDAPASEKEWQTYAHYCLGVIYVHLDLHEEARPHLERVTELDPDDGYGWYKLGQSVNHEDPKRAAACFERAMRLDPNIGGALWAWCQNSHVRATVPLKEVKQRLDFFKEMKTAELFNAEKDRYSELGRYCEVIGRRPHGGQGQLGPAPQFSLPEKVALELGDGAEWAPADAPAPGDTGALLGLLRKRFGGVLVFLDYDRDGKTDVFVPGAVVRKGELGDLLLRNDGGHFADVTAKAGLAGPRRSLACTAADFDNDGRTDLLVTGADGVRLFRNRPGGTFEDVTAKAGLNEVKAVCLGSAFVDIDQDGDLDLVLSRFAADAGEAVGALKGEKRPAGPGFLLYLNKGQAMPAAPVNDPPPLEPSFGLQKDAAFEDAGGGVAVVVSDLDLDRDLDLLLLTDGAPPALVLNDRLLRFRRAALPEAVAGAAPWNGALVLDIDRDERSELVLLRHDGEPLLLLRSRAGLETGPEKWFSRGTLRAPRLHQALAVDVDLDGRPDVTGLSTAGRPVLIHNAGAEMPRLMAGLGSEEAWPAGLAALGVTDLDGDGRPDVLGWSPGEGLWRAGQKDNGNHALLLRVTGHRRVDKGGEAVRTNADGFGTRVIVHAGEHWTCQEYTTLSAGLGQSSLPALLGLGRHAQAELVRLRWPDNVWQAEFNFDAGRTHVIEETNRKETSCPVLFAWDGERFRYLTDFLGAGTMGEMTAGGGHRKPRPEESVKIEADQLRPRDGQLVLRIAEPMDEISYLDRLQLIVLDHPAGAGIYPDERFATSDPPATQDLLSFERRIRPVAARDHRNRDVTAKLRAWDRDMVDGFARRMWLGFAEEHAVEMDFGDRLKEFGPKDRLVLFLAGWTDYAFPESIWAAGQASVPVQAPVLERKGADGKWHAVAEVGFPAGLPRMMAFDVTGKVGGSACVLRLRTNLRVHWDEAFLAPVVDRVAPDKVAAGSRFGLFRATPLEVSQASVYGRGFMQEYSPDGKLPTLYDYDRLSPMMVNRPAGRMTRYGEVTELLREADDCFVIFGPGDEVDVRFDAGGLPPLPEGWVRSYVLRTWGYCKDSGPFTAHADTVGPLPFRAMSNYPYAPGEKYPDTPKHREYLRRYNTRQVGPAGR